MQKERVPEARKRRERSGYSPSMIPKASVFFWSGNQLLL
jgi:hypothetical protein